MVVVDVAIASGIVVFSDSGVYCVLDIAHGHGKQRGPYDRHRRASG